MTFLPSDLADSPFALIEKHGQVTLYRGRIHEIDGTAGIHELAARENRDIVFALPYRTIRERGFEARGDEPILALAVESASGPFPAAALRRELPERAIKLDSPVTPSVSDEDHAGVVRRFQQTEIEGGNASQVNLSRVFSGRLADPGLDTILSIYRGLLVDRGQYMTVLFANIGGQEGAAKYIVGATPECHLEITRDNTVMMPIAGTLRKEDPAAFEQRLQSFLTDPKEINELYQVTDEELKMMGRICPQGGVIEGPHLKEIGNVVHTFYRLVGKRSPDSIDSLRHTLHAPTVVGSPMESAAKIISSYEPLSRRYYGGEIGIYSYVTRAPAQEFGDMDVAILIRCAEISGGGDFRIQAGGGLVRDSDPASEVKETRAKASIVLDAISGKDAPVSQWLTEELHRKYHPVLMERNRNLSKFWMNEQTGDRENLGLRVTIINNEDDFALMQAHMINRLGCRTEVVDTFDFDPARDESDVVLVGPGPGDINDKTNKRMVKLRESILALRQEKRPLLGICLGHQAISAIEGIEVVRQRQSSQGMQRMARIFGGDYLLGFYNSFSPVFTDAVAARKDIAVDLDDEGRIVAMQGPGFIGFQFHPESIMSEFGSELLAIALKKLAGKK